MIRNILKAYRKSINKLEWKNRRLTAKSRALPSFIVIGAQKSGTTSLRGYIKQHPYVRMSFHKEVHFFDRHYSEGVDWYRSQFPILRNKHSSIAIGESSPYYLVYPHAPRRIHALLPSAKLIAILRNPRERAISHYYHQVKKNRESLPIMQALLAEEDRISDGWKQMEKDEYYLPTDHRYYSYKQRGIYVDQLKQYYEFFDKDNILVINSERLFSNPQNVLYDISIFLGIDPILDGIKLSHRNVGIRKNTIPEEVKHYLNDYFLPHNKRLYELIGQDYKWDE